jgi:hypothetical protein
MNGPSSEIPQPSQPAEPLDRDVRAWANRNGYELGPEDPITPEILAAYRAAHQ